MFDTQPGKDVLGELDWAFDGAASRHYRPQRG